MVTSSLYKRLFLKHIRSTHLLLCLLLVQPFVTLRAQDGDSTSREVVRGWSFGAFPTVSISNTLGFQYGVYGNLFYYGDGTSYPDPLHKITFEASHFTKGRSRFYLALDTKRLLPGWRLTLSALYIIDPLAYFYGFNGAASPYVDSLDNRHYYALDRRFFQAFANLQRPLTDHLKLAGGLSYSHYDIGDFDDSKYDGNASSTLYHYYVAQGLIDGDERAGGHVGELRGGIVYDTRDIEAAPNRGLLAEVFLNGSIASGGHHYLKACAYFSHFVRLPLGLIPAGDPVFAYRLAYSGKLAGDVPFYMQQIIPMLVPHTMLTEGLGSAKTMRGLFENRIVANGIAWGNFELRVKLVKFTLLRQYFYIAVNPFFDCGIVTQSYRLQRQAAAYGVDVSSLRHDSQRLATAAGMGFKLAWNENFIVSLELARSFEPVLGNDFWFDAGVNYVF